MATHQLRHRTQHTWHNFCVDHLHNAHDSDHIASCAAVHQILLQLHLYCPGNLAAAVSVRVLKLLPNGTAPWLTTGQGITHLRMEDRDMHACKQMCNQMARAALTWTLIFCQSMLWADDLRGSKLLLRQPSAGQDCGGVNLPSSNWQVLLVLHLLQVKSIWVIWGLTAPMRTTIPHTVTSLPIALAFINRICMVDSGWLTRRILVLASVRIPLVSCCALSGWEKNSTCMIAQGNFSMSSAP